jgi:hypothetical protein
LETDQEVFRQYLVVANLWCIHKFLRSIEVPQDWQTGTAIQG